MSLLTLFITAVGLSMDAFAVAICKGLAMRKLKLSGALTVGLWFGGFQALMPLIGYLVGSAFADKITAVDHWVAFVLLSLIGANMIKESFEKEEEGCRECDSLSIRAMLPMAVATSIDALAVGVSFAFLKVNILWAVLFIGVITFTLSAVGVWVGTVFGTRFKSKAERIGGLILIAMGTKILIEHLFLNG